MFCYLFSTAINNRIYSSRKRTMLRWMMRESHKVEKLSYKLLFRHCWGQKAIKSLKEQSLFFGLIISISKILRTCIKYQIKKKFITACNKTDEVSWGIEYSLKRNWCSSNTTGTMYWHLMEILANCWQYNNNPNFGMIMDHFLFLLLFIIT